MPTRVEGILTDDELAKEVARCKERNIAAELATQKIAERTRRDNRMARERYEKAHAARMAQQVENSLSHLKVFAKMNDNSPYRVDVVKNTARIEGNLAKEARQEAIFKKTYDKLAAMTGVDEEFIVNKNTGKSKSKIELSISLIVFISVSVEWCIGKPLSSSITSYSNTSIAHNHHTKLTFTLEPHRRQAYEQNHE